MIKKYSMKDLLEKYKDCDSFSLTGTIEKVIITEQDKIFALEEIKKENKKYLYEQYNLIKENYSLDSFEDLYQDIEQECIEFNNTRKEQYIKEYGFFQSAFIVDQVGKNTKYSTPHNYFWHFYHIVAQYFDRVTYIEGLIKQKNTLKPVDKIKDKVLISNLKKYEILFHNHCTESSILMVNYYFDLNDETKKWLLKFKNDFKIKGNLYDLAFYKNNELIFSSCTHEQYNSLSLVDEEK